MKLVLALLVAGAAVIAIGSCTLLDDDPPDDRCTFDTDCFQAQGEICNQRTKRCEIQTAIDAGIDAP